VAATTLCRDRNQLFKDAGLPEQFIVTHPSYLIKSNIPGLLSETWKKLKWRGKVGIGQKYCGVTTTRAEKENLYL